MVRREKTSESEDTGERKGIIEELRENVIECIGNICFTPEGKIVVKVDKDKDPKCAKLCADYVLAGHEVVFEVTRTVGVDVKEPTPDTKVGKKELKKFVR